MSDEIAHALHNKAQQGVGGGWYPVGQTGLWHNGVHLRLGSNANGPVLCVADGRLVAVRFRLKGEALDAKPAYPLGSPSFALVQHALRVDKTPEKEGEHEISELRFYTLYMHLDFDSPSDDVPWLNTFLPFLKSNTPIAEGNLYRLDGAPEKDAKAPKKRGLNAWGKVDLVDKKPKPTAKKGKKGPAAPPVTPPAKEAKPQDYKACLPKGTVVEKLDTEEKDGYMHVRAYLRAGPLEAWVREGNHLLPATELARQVSALRSGGCARLDYPVNAGDVLGHAGVIQPIKKGDSSREGERGVHLELFAQENFIPAEQTGEGKPWTLLDEDRDEDAIVNPAVLLNLVDKATGSGKLPSGDEIARNPKARKAITRNTSFWSVNWPAAMKEKSSWRNTFHVTDDDLKDAQKYMWWQECQALGVPLPGSPVVHHYHPVAALEFLKTLMPQPPVFYVKRNGEDLSVTRPEQLIIYSRAEIAKKKAERTAVMAENKKKKPKDRKIVPDNLANEVVHVHEPGVEDWALGTGASMTIPATGALIKGIARTGSPNLQEMFFGTPKEPLDPAKPLAVPSIDEFSKRIWASMAHVEGGLDAINSWDRAFLSIGPIQQTAGTADALGELPGAVARVPLHVVQRHLIDFKLSTEPEPKPEAPADISADTKIAHGFFVRHRDTILRTPELKEELRDFFWAYRFVKAMHDPEFRVPFLKYGLTIRPKVILNLSSAGVCVKDVYKTELALALLLDTHVNMPALLMGSWSDSKKAKASHPDKDQRKAERHERPLWLEAALKVVSPPAGKTLADAKISNAQELKMIKAIIELRRYSGMTDPAIRSAKVLMSVEGLTDKLAQSLGYDDADDVEEQSQIAERRSIVRHRACRETGTALASSALVCHPGCA